MSSNINFNSQNLIIFQKDSSFFANDSFSEYCSPLYIETPLICEEHKNKKLFVKKAFLEKCNFSKVILLMKLFLRNNLYSRMKPISEVEDCLIILSCMNLSLGKLLQYIPTRPFYEDYLPKLDIS